MSAFGAIIRRASLLACLTGAGLLLFVPFLSVFAQPQDAPEKPADPTGKALQIPEGTDGPTIRAFLNQLDQSRPTGRTLPERREHFLKIDALLSELQSRTLDEVTTLQLAELRFRQLRLLESTDFPEAVTRRSELVKWSKAHPLPSVRRQGAVFELVELVTAIPVSDQVGRRRVIEAVDRFVNEGELENDQAKFALETAGSLIQLQDYSLASVALKRFTASFQRRNDSRLEDLIALLQAMSRRVDLPGHPMLVKGKTLDGQDFDLTQWKGKVVLVDFWATWCVPCLQELPNIRSLYDSYHARGFEVIGISLDERREVLSSFLTEEKLPWPQLDELPHEGLEQKSTVTRHYGISLIPTAILIGADGKVVSLNARGRELARLLERHLGPATESSGQEPVEVKPPDSASPVQRP